MNRSLIMLVLGLRSPNEKLFTYFLVLNRQALIVYHFTASNFYQCAEVVYYHLV